MKWFLNINKFHPYGLMKELRTALLKKLLKAHVSTLEKTVTSEIQREIIHKDIQEIKLELVRRKEHLELVHTESI